MRLRCCHRYIIQSRSALYLMKPLVTDLALHQSMLYYLFAILRIPFRIYHENINQPDGKSRWTSRRTIGIWTLLPQILDQLSVRLDQSFA